MKKLSENKEELWCEYSDLPSPMAYIEVKEEDIKD